MKDRILKRRCAPVGCAPVKPIHQQELEQAVLAALILHRARQFDGALEAAMSEPRPPGLRGLRHDLAVGLVSFVQVLRELGPPLVDLGLRTLNIQHDLEIERRRQQARILREELTARAAAVTPASTPANAKHTGRRRSKETAAFVEMKRQGCSPGSIRSRLGIATQEEWRKVRDRARHYLKRHPEKRRRVAALLAPAKPQA